MPKHPALWFVVLLAAAVVVVASVVAVVVLMAPSPTPLLVRYASNVGLMEGNLTSVSSGQPLLLDIAATTTASEADGAGSNLTLRLVAWLFYVSASHQVILNVNATAGGVFAPGLHPERVQISANVSASSSSVYYGAFLWGENVSFGANQYSWFGNGGHGTVTATPTADAFVFSDPTEAFVMPQPSFFLGFNATVSGSFSPPLSVSVLLHVVDEPFPPTPRAIGIAVTKSADGSNWVLTFTAVPTGLSNGTTLLTVVNSSGQTVVAWTALGSLYTSPYRMSIAYIPATGTGDLSAGDRVLLAVAAYPTGDQFQISNSGSILCSAILQ